jgi:hypothetical protein
LGVVPAAGVVFADTPPEFDGAGVTGVVVPPDALLLLLLFDDDDEPLDDASVLTVGVVALVSVVSVVDAVVDADSML